MCYSQYNAREKPFDEFPSTDELVNVTLNSKKFPSVVLPNIGIIWDASGPHTREEDPTELGLK